MWDRTKQQVMTTSKFFTLNRYWSKLHKRSLVWEWEETNPSEGYNKKPIQHKSLPNQICKLLLHLIPGPCLLVCENKVKTHVTHTEVCLPCVYPCFQFLSQWSPACSSFLGQTCMCSCALIWLSRKVGAVLTMLQYICFSLFCHGKSWGEKLFPLNRK